MQEFILLFSWQELENARYRPEKTVWLCAIQICPCYKSAQIMSKQ